MNNSRRHNTIKSFIIYMMTLAYAFGLIKPVLPLVNDLVQHTFNKMEHMATVHYENGKYHVHTELQQEAQKSEPQKTPAFSNDDTLSTHLQAESLSLAVYQQQISEIAPSYNDDCKDVILPTPILPPRC